MSKMTRTKAWVALIVSVIGDALTIGLIPEAWRPLAISITSAAVVLGVERARNRPIPPQV
jgi:hypothetical protein